MSRFGCEPIRERLLRLSIPEPNSGCWIWLGCIKYNGYGTIGLFSSGKRKTHHAHRVSYQHFKGHLDDELDLDHLCRLRCCINPDHLEPVTRSENLKRSPLMSRQGNKTTCPKGHPYSGTNNRGQRICHICAAEHSAKQRQKHDRKEAA